MGHLQYILPIMQWLLWSFIQTVINYLHRITMRSVETFRRTIWKEFIQKEKVYSVHPEKSISYYFSTEIGENLAYQPQDCL